MQSWRVFHVLLIAGFLLAVLTLLFKSDHEANNSALALHSRETITVNGTVTEYRPWDHALSVYQYPVGGKNYQRTVFLGLNTKPGSILRVHYDPARPWESFTDIEALPHPRQTLLETILNGFIPIVTMVVAAAFASALAWTFWIRWRKPAWQASKARSGM